MKNLTQILTIALIAIATISCKKQEECKPTEIIVTVHDTIIGGDSVHIYDTVFVNPEPIYTTTGTWNYYRKEFSINNGSWETEFKNEKWKFTAYRVFVDANNDGVYEREGFFGNFGTYITIYFYDETTARKYDIISSDTQSLTISRTIGTIQEKLYMQKL